MTEDFRLDEGKPLLILNDRHSRSGAGRYASQLYEATSSYSDFVSSVWLVREKRLEYPGIRFEPTNDNLLPILDNIQAYLSLLFPQIFRRNYFAFVTQMKRKKRAVHYSSQLVPLIKPSQTDIVSILDLIALDTFPKYPFNYLRVKKFLKFSHILTISDVEREKVGVLSSNSEPQTIHPYVSKSFFPLDKAAAREKLNLKTKKHIVLSISSAESRKNTNIITEVMEKLGNDYLLVRVGPRLKSELNFINIDDKTLNFVYNSADVLLFPTLSEGFGYPLIEAMACGVPLVSSDIPVVREVTGGSAILTDPFSVTQLTESILDLVNDSNDIVQRELKRSRYFTLERFQSELLNYYKKIGVLDQ